MIIYMDDYRKVEDLDNLQAPRLAEERMYGNGPKYARQLQLAPINAYRTRRDPTPDLPEHFDDVDLREFIEHVSALATQI